MSSSQSRKSSRLASQEQDPEPTEVSQTKKQTKKAPTKNAVVEEAETSPAKANKKKRARADSDAEGSETTPAKKPKTKKSKKKDTKDADANEEEANSLYAAISRKSVAITPVVDELAKRLSDEIKAKAGASPKKASKKGSAMGDLINFVIRSSGCELALSAAELGRADEEKTAEIVKELLESDDKNAWLKEDYPIASKSKDLKHYRRSFAEFWKRLIKATQNSLVFQEEFIPVVLSWLHGMTLVTQRPLRHTATFAALCIAQELCELAAELQKSADAAERMGKAAKKSGAASGAVSSKKEQLDNVNENLGFIWGQIFFFRYRDTSEDIRCDCLASFGKLVSSHPTLFLEEKYLQCIGLLLNDKTASVRRGALQALNEITKSLDKSPALSSFLTKCQGRLAAMALDKDTATAVEAFKLFHLLVKFDIFTDKEKNDITALVEDQSPQLRAAVADYITADVLGEEGAKPKKGKRKAGGSEEKDGPTAETVLALLTFIESKDHNQKVEYTIDSLWGKSAVLTAWPLLVKLITDDEDNDLTDQQRSTLVQVLACCVIKANGFDLLQESPGSRAEDVELDESLPPLLAKAIPTIFTKYAGEAETLAWVAVLVQYVDVEAFTAFRLQTQFTQVLDGLRKAFTTSVNDNVQRQVARAYKHLRQEHALKREVEKAFQATVDFTLKAFHKQVEALSGGDLTNASQSKKRRGSNAGEEVAASGDNAEALAIAAGRVQALMKVEDLAQTDETLYDALVEVLKVRLEQSKGANSSTASGAVNAEATVQVVQTFLNLVVWSLAHVTPDEDEETTRMAVEEATGKKQPKKKNSTGASVSETQENLDSASESRTKAKTLLSRCVELLSDRSSMVKEEAFVAACSLIYTHSPYLAHLGGQTGKVADQLTFRANKEEVNAIQLYFDAVMSTYTDPNDEQEVRRKLRILEAFSQDILVNALTDSSDLYAPNVIVLFGKHGQAVSDVIKEFIHQIRERSKDHDDHNLIYKSLQLQWDAIVKAISKGALPKPTNATTTSTAKGKKKKTAATEEDDETEKKDGEEDEEGDAESGPYLELSRLARKLASTYGIASHQRKLTTRNALYSLVVKCLNFAVGDKAQRGAFIKFGVSHFVSKFDSVMAKKVLGAMGSNNKLSTVFATVDTDADDDDALIPFKEIKSQLARIANNEKSPRKATGGKKAAAKKTGGKAKVAKKLKLDDSEADGGAEVEAKAPKSPKRQLPTREKKAAGETARRASAAGEGEEDAMDVEERAASPKKRGSAKRTAKKAAAAAVEEEEGQSEEEEGGAVAAVEEEEEEEVAPSPKKPAAKGKAKAAANEKKRKRQSEVKSIYDSDDEAIQEVKKRKNDEAEEEGLLAGTGITRASRSRAAK